MKLDDLLKGSEPVISEWLAQKDLLHDCDSASALWLIRKNSFSEALVSLS